MENIIPRNLKDAWITAQDVLYIYIQDLVDSDEQLNETYLLYLVKIEPNFIHIITTRICICICI